MKKYEYQRYYDNEIPAINQAGAEGWRVAGIVPTMAGYAYILMERELPIVSHTHSNDRARLVAMTSAVDLAITRPNGGD